MTNRTGSDCKVVRVLEPMYEWRSLNHLITINREIQNAFYALMMNNANEQW